MTIIDGTENFWEAMNRIQSKTGKTIIVITDWLSYQDYLFDEILNSKGGQK